MPCLSCSPCIQRCSVTGLPLHPFTSAVPPRPCAQVNKIRNGSNVQRFLYLSPTNKQVVWATKATSKGKLSKKGLTLDGITELHSETSGIRVEAVSAAEAALYCWSVSIPPPWFSHVHHPPTPPSSVKPADTWGCTHKCTAKVCATLPRMAYNTEMLHRSPNKRQENPLTPVHTMCCRDCCMIRLLYDKIRLTRQAVYSFARSIENCRVIRLQGAIPAVSTNTAAPKGMTCLCRWLHLQCLLTIFRFRASTNW